MTEYKTTIPNRNNFAVINYTREVPRPQFNEDRSRYILISQQQPDQGSHKSFENTPTAVRPVLKLTGAAQGLRELQDKIDGALKRSSSATSIRPQQNIYANPLVTALNQTQHKVPRTYQTEATNESMESFYEPRSRMQQQPHLYASTIKVLPNNISTMPMERVVHFNSQTPQATSTGFYLGGPNPNGRNAEDLLNSVKNYQVKTIHTTLNSSRKHYISQNTTQNVPEKIYVQQPTGASIKLKNFTTQTDFQPGYDKEKLDSVISKIMHSHQNYPLTRQESFAVAPRTANITNYESYANSRVYESRAPRDNSREMMPQQYYHARPLQTVVNQVPVQTVYRRPVNEKKAPSRTEQSLKKSYIGEMQPDGDSMCEFLKENDQLLDFDEEVQPKKKTREVEGENFFVKKVPKRQEIINSKKLGRAEPHNEQPQRQRKEMSYKNNAPEMPQRNRRRI